MLVSVPFLRGTPGCHPSKESRPLLWRGWYKWKGPDLEESRYHHSTVSSLLHPFVASVPPEHDSGGLFRCRHPDAGPQSGNIIWWPSEMPLPRNRLHHDSNSCVSFLKMFVSWCLLCVKCSVSVQSKWTIRRSSSWQNMYLQLKQKSSRMWGILLTIPDKADKFNVQYTSQGMFLRYVLCEIYLFFPVRIL